jgi:hypothetical protein
MSASSFCFRTAVVFGLLGMVMGIIMAASHDHSVMPAHAHLNLLGWVSLFLFGIYYRLHSSIEASRLALTQVVVWTLATVVLTVGVAALYRGKSQGEPIAVAGSLLILADMVLFAVLVFRAANAVEKATRFKPAE